LSIFSPKCAFNDNAFIAIEGSNPLDEKYSLADGFPEPYRQFFASLRARF
jgi:iron complex outermembrane recepter protein